MAAAALMADMVPSSSMMVVAIAGVDVDVRYLGVKKTKRKPYVQHRAMCRR